MFNDQKQLRQTFFDAWDKYQQQRPLSALEKQIVAVMLDHPKLTDPEQDYTMEQNPFLHLSLHISLNEQVALDRPQGIKQIYQQLAQQSGDAHITQHQMMDIMAEILWQAQQRGQLPDDQTYLARLKNLNPSLRALLSNPNF